MVGLERFPDKQSFQRYQVRLQTAWEQFMSGERRTPAWSPSALRNLGNEARDTDWTLFITSPLSK